MNTKEFDLKKFSMPIDVDYLQDHGEVVRFSDGIAFCSGLEQGFYNERVVIDDRFSGIIMDLKEDLVGIGIIDNTTEIREGMEVRLTNEMVGIDVEHDLTGQVVNILGQSLYDESSNNFCKDQSKNVAPLFNSTPPIMNIASVTRPMETGLLVVDSLFPIGKGQRQLILGNRQIGKTQIALDTIINQKGKDVHCVYVSVGLKMDYIAEAIEILKQHDALAYSTVVATTADDSITAQYLAPYAGMALAESLMYQGKDVLLVLDNLTKHADAYRTISLLFNRPPGREAYPGDMFYIHSSLLERSVQMNESYGGGSITTLPIIEVLSNDVTAYIPTNVISITDGQLFLQDELFNAGQKPAIDVGISVSRIGGDAQAPVIRQLSRGLSLIVSQYNELKELLDFGNTLDKDSREIVDKGQILLELFKQNERQPLSSGEVATLLYFFQNDKLAAIDKEHLAHFKTVLFLKLKEQEWKEALDASVYSKEAFEELQPKLEDLLVQVQELMG